MQQDLIINLIECWLMLRPSAAGKGSLAGYSAFILLLVLRSIEVLGVSAAFIELFATPTCMESAVTPTLV
jgi:hypothetical protein